MAESATRQIPKCATEARNIEKLVMRPETDFEIRETGKVVRVGRFLGKWENPHYRSR
jgi:hypothetical protein